jgi:hypothetical protein
MTRSDVLRTLVGYARYPSQIHGPAHWSRVRRFGGLVAEQEGLPEAARQCVEIFALVHDLAREDDDGGNQHAIDGAAYIDEVVPAVFGRLPRPQLETVRVAVRYHSDGMVAREASASGLFGDIEWPRDLLERTIGCCWDTDRLDLLRVCVSPCCGAHVHRWLARYPRSGLEDSWRDRARSRWVEDHVRSNPWPAPLKRACFFGCRDEVEEAESRN